MVCGVGWLEEKCILSILSGYGLFEHFKYRFCSWKLSWNSDSSKISVYLLPFWVFSSVWLQRQVFVLAISSHPSYLDTNWSIWYFIVCIFCRVLKLIEWRPLTEIIKCYRILKILKIFITIGDVTDKKIPKDVNEPVCKPASRWW